MSALDRIMSSIRQVILMEAKLQTLADGVEKVADLVLDHERRLIRIETLVEVAQSNRLPPVDG
jgi:hypothetical protein